jgi:hypothetical protein
LHAKVDTIKSLVANVRAALGHVIRFAEQFPKLDRWRELLCYICARITASTPLQRTPSDRCNGLRSLRLQLGNCGF